ncbi:DUF6460 domain-containing protein [Bartonella ancashensis]|uniref:DUF6460 domain-containing protein n=1 Tax=Bartonella ancashensis TaxID=1318743 RepID=A0A0M4LGH9_9HYPH|nr:DUF6460 domain-containing protein [Bartonella ancashensis]ALE03544.1 hypothetical protein PU02_0730 [Bartonella ancashensis]
MSNSLHSFLGGTPGRVFVKILIISLLVGIVMNLFGWTFTSLIEQLVIYFEDLWDAGLITFVNIAHLIATGAVIVVPIFFFLRIFRKR